MKYKSRILNNRKYLYTEVDKKQYIFIEVVLTS